MGFDLTRFIGEIDEEFQCSICTMILENPVQSPCDHLFCSECIKGWLSINKTCPVDRKPLTVKDLEPINRSLRNLLNKLQIKCDFHVQGCNVLVKLECLQGHLTSCEHNPAARIVCDKGCNLEMSRCEYETSNCFTHLAINNEKENVKLNLELTNHKEHLDEVVHRQGMEIQRLRQQINQLDGVMSLLNEEMIKLSDLVHQLRSQQNHFETSVQPQTQQFTNLNDGAKVSLKWETWENIKGYFDQIDILERGDKNSDSFVRSFYSLQPKNSKFKVQILKGDLFWFGLAFKVPSTKLRKWFVVYESQSKTLAINGICKYVGSRRKIGDIIELGIKFPMNFANDGNASVQLYLSINERVEAEEHVIMPKDAIFPQIHIIGTNTKIKCLDI